MSDAPILVCDCGKRLRAPGATPGRVGRCPACGGLLRFAGAEPAPASADGAPPSAADVAGPVATEAIPAQRRRRRRRRRADGDPTAIWDGLITAPRHPETRIRDSLWYPLWGATGVAALVILPPFLWFTSILAYGGLATMLTAALGGNAATPGLMGLLLFMPGAIGLFCVLGYTLVFLGRMLAASALGEVHHPHWPDCEFTLLWFGLARWFWAALIGGLVGGLPATIYWVYCGDIDLFDTIILIELFAAGAAYGLMALLASILHDDALGANPFTVLSAIRVLGWSYVPPCLLAGAAGMLLLTMLAAISRVDASSPALSAFLVYMAWVVGLYASMVVLRVLGLYYHANARALGWFRGRTGWGV